MNRKFTAILILIVLAIVSVSIVTAVNNTSDVMELDDDTQDIQADDTGVDEIAADDSGVDEIAADDKNEKIRVEETDSDDKLQAEGSVIIKKVWVDNNNAAGKRPSSVTVKVKAAGQTETVVLSERTNWTNQVIVPVSDVEVEEEPVDGYTCKVTKNANVFIITNTLKDVPKNDTDDNKTVPEKKTPEKKTPTKKTVTKKKVTTTKKTTKTPSKAAAKNQTKKAKDKHNTGNPVLLGALAVSLAGLAISFRRKE